MEWKDETAMDDVPYIAAVLPICHSLDAIEDVLYFSSRPAAKQLMRHQIVPCTVSTRRCT